MAHNHRNEYPHGEIEYQGRRFAITSTPDEDAGPPWQDYDGHGPVSDWRPKDSKRPGELILHEDQDGTCRFYDMAEAQRIALKDQWGIPQGTAQGYTLTKPQIAHLEVRADFEYLKGWCTDQWHYVTVAATLLDDDGEPTEYTSYCGGVEDSQEAHILEIGKECAAEAWSDYEADQALAQAKAEADRTVHLLVIEHREPDGPEYSTVHSLHRSYAIALLEAARYRLTADAAGEIIASYWYPEHGDHFEADLHWTITTSVETRRIEP